VIHFPSAIRVVQAGTGRAAGNAAGRAELIR
jgi:hypothetical protein